MTSPARKDPLPSIITRGSTYCYRTGPLTGTELGDSPADSARMMNSYP